MKVEVAYVSATRQFATAIDLPDGATIAMAIEYSGVLNQFPDIDLNTQKVGVYGKVKPLNAALADGERVEIYRAVFADPAKVPRRAGAAADDDES